MFALRITDRSFMLVRTIILARLLAPNDFGLLGIAMLALATLESFTQTGIDAALIQKKEDTKAYLDSAWTIQILRGIILSIILAIGASLVGTFFKEPRAIMLIRVLAISVFIFSFRNIGIVYFRKELEFHKQFVYQFSGTIADLAVTIPAAFILKSVWALVFGLLARNVILVIISYIIHSYRPTFKLDIEKTKELINFGKLIFAQSIILFLLVHGDDAFVGKILGAAALGFYQLAYRFSNVAATEVTHVISGVTIPAYSKLQDDIGKLRIALKKTLKFTSFISIPLASGVFILAPEFTRIFLGNKWMPMVPTMQVLCLFGAMRSIGATFGPVYRALAKVYIALKINITQLLVLVIIIYPFTKYWGILGTSIAITLSLFVALVLTSRRIIEVLDTSFYDLFEPLLFFLVASAGMVFMIWTIKTYFITTFNYFTVVSLAVIGVASFWVFIYVISKISSFNLHDITSFLKDSVRGKRNVNK